MIASPTSEVGASHFVNSLRFMASGDILGVNLACLLWYFDMFGSWARALHLNCTNQPIVFFGHGGGSWCGNDENNGNITKWMHMNKKKYTLYIEHSMTMVVGWWFNDGWGCFPWFGRDHYFPVTGMHQTSSRTSPKRKRFRRYSGSSILTSDT